MIYRQTDIQTDQKQHRRCFQAQLAPTPVNSSENKNIINRVNYLTEKTHIQKETQTHRHTDTLTYRHTDIQTH